MDNASKALIMAGAILIAVALVSLGVYLYQSAAGTVGDATSQLSANEIQMKNQEFEQFEGTIKGSEVKSLIRKVQAFNSEKVFPDDIKINNKVATTIKTTDYTDSKTYTVTLTYATTGARYITNITIN